MSRLLASGLGAAALALGFLACGGGGGGGSDDDDDGCFLGQCQDGQDGSAAAGDDGPSPTGPSVGNGGPAGATTGGGDGTVQQLCVDLINGYRATVGVPALARWTSAEACSDAEALSDGQTNTPHGAFGMCGEFAQNECPGWPGPPEQLVTECLQMMWDEGPGGGHYENMRGDYTEVACGFATMPDGSIWAVQNFR